MGNLHPAVEGAIIGVIIAIVLYLLELYLLKKQAKERAIRQHKPNVVVLDETEKARLTSGRIWGASSPLFFALMYWMTACLLCQSAARQHAPPACRLGATLQPRTSPWKHRRNPRRGRP